MKHEYKIIFNRAIAEKNPYLFDYGNTKNIRLSLAKGAAVVSFEMGTKKSAEDFVTFTAKIFREIYRKVYIVYLLRFGTSLTVKEIQIIIDGECTTVNADNNSHFPLLFSMLENVQVDLNAGWKKIIPFALMQAKTSVDQDRRMTAVFSFLVSKGKYYQIDRLQNLWTSMNAVYNYYAGRYEHDLKKECAVKKGENLPKVLRLEGSDGLSIGLMCWFLEHRYKSISSDESKKLIGVYQRMEKFLCKLPRESIADFYDNSFAALNGKCELKAEYAEAADCSECFGVSPFSFMILGYAYYCRCKYLHGNQTTLLFSAYNDPEVRSFEVINYFLERYLCEIIPAMFEKNNWNQDKFRDAVDYVLNTVDGAQKRYNKLLNEKTAE